uniref:Uncharacterized protein n=1 Tax=Rhizophora mucronata TaxID=61149 RepID=A0A2P2Q788_RHIMU
MCISGYIIILTLLQYLCEAD